MPKVDKSTFEAAAWPKAPSNEWCPPGHGDLYAALEGSGKLDALLAAGVKYMFVSNSDNLGATLDLKLLTYFAKSGKPFIMECCERTEADKKGGHLAMRTADGQLVLRESAQCADEDEKAFQDITKHRFFNTNNLWVRLDLLKEAITAKGGFIPLPMIKNGKTVDPKDDASPKVIQLETAMGAAIECFKGAGAVVVPRTRFAPVKKCNDLLLLRSNAFSVVDSVIGLSPKVASGKAPVVDLDSKAYKLVDQLEAATRGGEPSLTKCDKLVVKGKVNLTRRNVFVGTVTVVNSGDEPKTLPPATYTNTTIDLTAAPGAGALRVEAVKTSPIAGQKPGTSGLRKKTKVFMDGLYLHNFVQAVFTAVKQCGSDIENETLVIGGDGRYYNPEATQVILKIAAANGVKRVWIGQHGLFSTPAASAVVRERGPSYMKAFGAFILSASHNPGGPDEDFGIKYNCENGGPSPEKMTDLIYEGTTKIDKVMMCPDFPAIDLAAKGVTRVDARDGSGACVVEVIDAVYDHVSLLKKCFDFDAIKALLARPEFSFVYDSMHGVQGPYAQAVFVDELGAPSSSLMNATPKDDFNGGHADPNLTYAKELVARMGLDKTGEPIATASEPPAFGAAADGDADRNMILGRKFFVTPSDSLAIIAAHANVIPFFRDAGGLKAVARSMPTSGAVDLVAEKLNLDFFETPTGWKFFGNLMDSKCMFGGKDYTPFICGEESFGTGSNHVREKDGMWAVLAWMQILAFYNADASKAFVHVEDVVKQHWATYGRNYYCRYDYEGVDKAGATEMFAAMTAATASNTGKVCGSYTIGTADVFEYVDPVDASVSKNQGIRFLMTDGSRIIFRISGTGSVGATVRLYIEKYEAPSGSLHQKTADVVGELVQIALQLSGLPKFTGRDAPTVIT